MTPENDAELDRIKKAVEALGEHFDSVQIFATLHDAGGDGGTVNVNYGCGNWFSRYGQVCEWKVKADERTRKAVQGED